MLTFGRLIVRIFSGDIMTLDYAEMGKRIADRRNKIKIRQNILAERIGISNNHLSNIERGKEKPSVDILIEICKALDVTPDYLLMGNMYSNNVPQNITDSLRLCSKEDIELISHIVGYMVKKRESEWNNQNYI